MSAKVQQSELTPLQRRGISALLTSRDQRTAALAVGVSEKSMSRWMNTPTFRQALLEAEGDVIDQAVRQLLQLQSGALQVLHNVMADTEGPAGLRLRAASVVLDALFKLRELRNLEQRITELERAVLDGQDG